MVNILTDYLRNMELCPLPKGQSGENTNPQPGKCNNFNDRKNDGKPLYIMQHHTVADFDQTITIFTTQKVSAHYVIPKDGTIQEFVSPEYRAYHAGIGNLADKSKLLGNITSNILKNDMNSWSVGIENVNNGNEEFTKEQIKSNILLCQKLCDDYPTIDPKYMLAHSDWAIGRKIDPSPFFDWATLAKASELFSEEVTKNFGIYPRKEELNLQSDPEIVLTYEKWHKNEVLKDDVEFCQSLLKGYGYDIPDNEIGEFGSNTQKAILAYRIHFAGSEILKDDFTKTAWSDLCKNDSNREARNALTKLDKNDLEYLGDIIAQF